MRKTGMCPGVAWLLAFLGPIGAAFCEETPSGGGGALEKVPGSGSDVLSAREFSLGSTVPIVAGWDAKNGFYLTDAEKGYFLLRIGGRLQVRYTYQARDKRGGVADPGETRDVSVFELERARLSFGGHVIDPHLAYFIQLEADTDHEGSGELLDAYVQYHAGELLGASAEAFSVGVGQWKPYFLRQEATSSARQQFVERSLANEFFNIDRNLGAWIQGDLHPLFYAFAVTNGFDSINVPFDETDQIPAFVGKLDVAILGKEGGKYEEGNVAMKPEPTWVVGVSLASDQNNGSSDVGTSQPFKAYQFGLDTIFKWSLFSLQAEYMGRWLKYRDGNNVPGMAGDGDWHYAHGFYVQGGVFLLPGAVEVAGRASAIWCDGPRGGNAFEAGPCLNWYISRSHKVKFQTDLSFFDISDDIQVQTETLDRPRITGGSVEPFQTSAAAYRSGTQGFMWRAQLQLQF